MRMRFCREEDGIGEEGGVVGCMRFADRIIRWFRA
jgi:hypothetical protein